MAQSRPMMHPCPSCHSDHTRRGGKTIWLIYAILIALAIPPVLLLHVNAAIVAGIMIAVVVIAHLVLNERVCVDCGNQWRE